ncbi:MAG: hypothetical protein FJW40_02390 [Acidobacteria bacterium]|nr:hypothetical protein [Acidobacteriota bacterium]
MWDKRRRQSGPRGGLFHVQDSFRRAMVGFGEGEFVRLRDEFGNEWRGSGELQTDGTVRYRLRDSSGRAITGISEKNGLILRDDRGNVWRGFVD